MLIPRYDYSQHMRAVDEKKVQPADLSASHDRTKAVQYLEGMHAPIDQVLEMKKKLQEGKVDVMQLGKSNDISSSSNSVSAQAAGMTGVNIAGQNIGDKELEIEKKMTVFRDACDTRVVMDTEVSLNFLQYVLSR